MISHLYRYRPAHAVLGKYEELAKQEIYFSPPEELNDPMEGYKDVYSLRLKREAGSYSCAVCPCICSNEFQGLGLILVRRGLGRQRKMFKTIGMAESL
jgi:hypothetical protein